MNDPRTWHDLPQDRVLAELDVTTQGLSEAEARQRLAQHGPNRLPDPPRRSLLVRFLLQFHNVLIYVLLGAAVITALLDHLVDSAVILGVVLVNAIIGFVQEGKAEKAMDAIRGMLAPRAVVLRDGQRHTVPGEQVVPGDVVLLEAGDKVPADLRLLKIHGPQIQEAILTGESVAVEKHTQPVARDAPLGDRTCLAFSGTTVTSGQASGVVVATGAATEIGRISGMLVEVEQLTTPLVEQMPVFAKWLTFFILTVAGLLLAFGYFVLHYDFGDLFMAVVGLSVAAIPEGLPAVLTITLAVGVQAHGLTVAMTGDGVNDAPALKRADAGIAMGQKGSEAAKEASELVLADDNFASIAAAVREGRTVYDNIKKVISWTLPTNAGEASTIILALLLGMALPITPIQILWVNMVTAVTLGIALAFEPTEENTMRRPPRPRHKPLLTGTLLWHIILVATLFLAGVFGIYAYATDRGYSVELARTLAMNTLVVMEIFHLFFIRNIYGTSLTWQAVRGTKVVWGAVITVTLGQFAITYLPVAQAIFATEPVPFLDGVLMVGIGIALFTIIEIEKQIRLRLAPAAGF